MQQLIALHLLHLTSAVVGQVDVIQPGQRFAATQADDVERLLALGAVRKPREGDTKTLVERGGAVIEGESEVVEDLSKLNKADLLALAAAEGVEADDSLTKAQIVSAIEAARAAAADLV